MKQAIGLKGNIVVIGECRHDAQRSAVTDGYIAKGTLFDVLGGTLEDVQRCPTGANITVGAHASEWQVDLPADYEPQQRRSLAQPSLPRTER